MARPRSDDKRNAILTAATQAVAEQGTGAPTARIARLAGVAEGTVFTYFANKDELLNVLYLTLKLDLREAIIAGFPEGGPLLDRRRHAWRRYIDWGVANPDMYKALTQLVVSDRITEATRLAGDEAFKAVDSTFATSYRPVHLPKEQALAFGSALLLSLAETTMTFVAREPDLAQAYTESGFEAAQRLMESN